MVRQGRGGWVLGAVPWYRIIWQSARVNGISLAVLGQTRRPIDVVLARLPAGEAGNHPCLRLLKRCPFSPH